MLFSGNSIFYGEVSMTTITRPVTCRPIVAKGIDLRTSKCVGIFTTSFWRDGGRRMAETLVAVITGTESTDWWGLHVCGVLTFACLIQREFTAHIRHKTPILSCVDELKEKTCCRRCLRAARARHCCDVSRESHINITTQRRLIQGGRHALDLYANACIFILRINKLLISSKL